MKSWMVIAALTGALTSLAGFEENFKIRPYFLLSDQKLGFVSFELNNPEDLNVEIQYNRFGKTKKVVYRPYEDQKLYKLPIGKNLCETTFDYKLSNIEGEYISGHIPSYPCDKEEEITFGHISDTQMKKESHYYRHIDVANMVDTVTKSFPMNFILNTGDVVHWGGREKQWTDFFKVADKYLDESFHVTAIGNHEYYETDAIGEVPESFKKYMQAPNQDKLGKMKLNFPQFDLIVLNSNFKQIFGEVYESQLSWLESELQKSYDNNKAVIITMHHSPFSSSIENRRKIPKALRRDFVPVFEKFPNVKLFLSGHLHMYERSYKNGIHYVTAGPAAGRYNIWSWPNRHSEKLKAGVATFSVVKVKAKGANIMTYSHDLNIIDDVFIEF